MASWPSERRASCRASPRASTLSVPFSILAWPWILPWRVPLLQRPDHRRPNSISSRQLFGGGHSRAFVRPYGPHWQPTDLPRRQHSSQLFSIYILNKFFILHLRSGCNKLVNYSCPARTSFRMSENCQGAAAMEVL